MSALLFLVGCGSDKVEVKGENGASATVETQGGGAKITATDEKGKTSSLETSADGKSVKVQSENGTSKLETNTAVTEAELGMPFYPGAKQDETGTLKMDTPEGMHLQVLLTSSDAPEKVAEFYKAKVTNPSVNKMSNDGTSLSTVSGKAADGKEVAITATKEKDSPDTKIIVIVTSKTKK